MNVPQGIVDSKAIAQPAVSKASVVLTSSDGQKLTQGMINNGIGMAELLADRKFTVADK